MLLGRGKEIGFTPIFCHEETRIAMCTNRRHTYCAQMTVRCLNVFGILGNSFIIYKKTVNLDLEKPSVFCYNADKRRIAFS